MPRRINEKTSKARLDEPRHHETKAALVETTARLVTMSDEGESQQYVCTMCKTPILFVKGEPVDARLKGGQRDSKSYLCNKCNSLMSRITRLQKQNQDAELGINFTSMTNEERAAWMLEQHNSFGGDLKLKLTTTRTKSSSSKQFASVKGRGTPLDEIDLRMKYTGKPEQLESVMKNARTFVHPIRNVRVWEDIDFHTEAESSHTRLDEEEVTAEVDEKYRSRKSRRWRLTKVSVIKQKTNTISKRTS